MQHHLLLAAAVLLTFVGCMHSYLGERYVLGPLLALPNLPTLGGSRAYMGAVLRFAWHLTSIAWWGTAATLVVMWDGRGQTVIGVVLSVTFLLHGLISLVKSGGRHPAWMFFFLTAAAIWFGTR
ncbi:MAG: hypothetical protein HYV95_06600 [Opitutae bacterium]|nr:hypothetical protein [Opitutae bacterium]